MAAKTKPVKKVQVKNAAFKKPEVKDEVKAPAAKAKAVVETFPTGSDLALAAEDMNKVLKLEPQIDTTLKVKELTALITEAADAVVQKNDKLEADTWIVLKAIGAGPRKDDKAIKLPGAVPAPVEKEAAPKAETKAAKSEAPVTSRPGVLDSIEAILKDGKHTLKEIVAKLEKKYPDRPTKGLHHTAYSQVYTPPEKGTDWSSLRTKRGLKVLTNKEGQYWIGSGKSK